MTKINQARLNMRKYGLLLSSILLGSPLPAQIPPSPVPSVNSLFMTSDAESRSISPENLTGEKGQGGRTEVADGSARRAAAKLGKGWKVNPYFHIEPGDTLIMGQAAGPGIINHIWLTIGGKEEYRNAILRMYWDDETSPSVEVPVGDFFASGWGRDAVPTINSSVISVLSRSGFNSFWQMPFREKFKITMQNRGENRITLYYQIDYTLTQVPKEAAYFHAQFRMASPVPVGETYTIVDGIQGKGHYVGTYLGRAALSEGWWGEGEIKFFMDGDTDYPTINGTGEEDYFLGSYGYNDPGISHPQSRTTGQKRDFSSPYAGFYTVADPETRSKLLPPTSAERRYGQYRWHVFDPIRFKRDLKVTIQSLGWAGDGSGSYGLRPDSVASVAYWYQMEPHAPFPRLPSARAMTIPPLKRGIAPKPVVPATAGNSE